MVKSLSATQEPDTVALSMLAARKTLALVAAVMHIPAVHATLLEQNGILRPPSTPNIVMVICPQLPFNLHISDSAALHTSEQDL